MTDNKVKKENRLYAEIKKLQEKYLPYNETTLKRLAFAATIMIGWILIWALVFKMCDNQLLGMAYANLKDLTPMERIMWDIIPFNYRGTDYWIMRQKIDTLLNCFVFAPYGVLFCYIFKKKNILLNAAICFGLSLFIESLQFATMLGNPATEDLITNTLGCFIGYGINALIFERMSVKTKIIICTAANLICIGGVIYSLITLVGATDTIWGIITRTL
jgi:glycopeptide antibiotics resistance protein